MASTLVFSQKLRGKRFNLFMPQITKEEYAVNKHQIIVLPLHLLARKNSWPKGMLVPHFYKCGWDTCAPKALNSNTINYKL